MVVLITGVAGAGKTTIGRLLADSLGWDFHDADDLHPPRNRAKMRAGVALTDEDRWPWLQRVRALIDEYLARGSDAVIACSALRQSYRDALVADAARVKVVFLAGTYDLIRRRIDAREGHFFDPELLESQFATLEPPPNALMVDVAGDPRSIVATIRAGLGLVDARAE